MMRSPLTTSLLIILSNITMFSLSFCYEKEKNLGGLPVPKGMYGFLTIFLLKPNVERRNDIPNMPHDESMGRWLCTGTLLNGRWALTRAKPIVYYRYKEYWMVVETEFDPFNESIVNKYQVDWVRFHRKYESQEKLEYDIALVRTTQDVQFSLEVKAVNLGVPGEVKNEYIGCRLILWSWNRNTFHENSNMTRIRRAQIPIEFPAVCENELALTNAKYYSQHFQCLKQNSSENNYPFDQPCGINLGAPIVCNSIQRLWGIYLGIRGISECVGHTFKDVEDNKEYEGLNIYAQPGELLASWIEEVLDKDIFVNDFDEIFEHLNYTNQNETL